MKTMVFVACLNLLGLTEAVHSAELDQKTQALVGTWIVNSSGDNFGSKLIVREDGSISHSTMGEGDIERISADRYKLTFYGQGNVQLLIRTLGSQKLNVIGHWMDGVSTTIFEGSWQKLEPNPRVRPDQRPSVTNANQYVREGFENYPTANALK